MIYPYINLSAGLTNVLINLLLKEDPVHGKHNICMYQCGTKRLRTVLINLIKSVGEN